MEQLFACLALFALISASSSGNIDQSFVLVKVQRTIDLTSHIPKIASTLTIENTGKSAAKSFSYAVDPVLAVNLAYISATVSIQVLVLVNLLYDCKVYVNIYLTVFTARTTEDEEPVSVPCPLSKFLVLHWFDS